MRFSYSRKSDPDKSTTPCSATKKSTLSSDVGQVDSTLANEFKALVDVLDFLDAHSGDFVVSAETGISNDLLLKALGHCYALLHYQYWYKYSIVSIRFVPPARSSATIPRVGLEGHRQPAEEGSRSLDGDRR